MRCCPALWMSKYRKLPTIRWGCVQRQHRLGRARCFVPFHTFFLRQCLRQLTWNNGTFNNRWKRWEKKKSVYSVCACQKLTHCCRAAWFFNGASPPSTLQHNLVDKRLSCSRGGRHAPTVPTSFCCISSRSLPPKCHGQSAAAARKAMEDRLPSATCYALNASLWKWDYSERERGRIVSWLKTQRRSLLIVGPSFHVCSPKVPSVPYFLRLYLKCHSGWKGFCVACGNWSEQAVSCRLVRWCARPFSPADCIHHLQIFLLMGKLCLPLLVFQCICIN